MLHTIDGCCWHWYSFAIADALQAGGQVHASDAKTAYMNVNVALRRGKDKDFAQTRNGEWGLVEWYSGKSKGDAE